MIGKRIKINDYKFTYGQETVYINVFGVFKDNKNGNKYIVYSYDNKKLYYGSFFEKENIGTIMISKDTDIDIIRTFIDDILTGNISKQYDIVSLDNIDSIQVIDEKLYDLVADINKLNDLTIPKSEVKDVKKQPKKKMPLFVFGIILLFIVIGLFFFINPEVILGKNIIYSCTKKYNHKELPANVTDYKLITFNRKGNVIRIDVSTDYVFTDTEYYNEFKTKSYFYKYIDEADTYKFDDTSYVYRVFSKIEIDSNYFLPDTEEELILYFKNDGYDCKIKEE